MRCGSPGTRGERSRSACAHGPMDWADLDDARAAVAAQASPNTSRRWPLRNSPAGRPPGAGQPPGRTAGTGPRDQQLRAGASCPSAGVRPRRRRSARTRRSTPRRASQRTDGPPRRRSRARTPWTARRHRRQRNGPPPGTPGPRPAAERGRRPRRAPRAARARGTAYSLSRNRTLRVVANTRKDASEDSRRLITRPTNRCRRGSWAGLRRGDPAHRGQRRVLHQHVLDVVPSGRQRRGRLARIHPT